MNKIDFPHSPSETFAICVNIENPKEVESVTCDGQTIDGFFVAFQHDSDIECGWANTDDPLYVWPVD